MAVEVIGRSGKLNENSQNTRRYFVSGVASEADAIAEVAAVAPGVVNGLVLRSIDVDESVKNGYECEATWGRFQQREPPATGESSFSFEVATSPTRIVIPVSPQTVYPATGLTAPSNSAKWLIGQQGDGSPPEGAEVFEPLASFAQTHYLSNSTVTAAHQRALLRIVGRLNNASFKGWQAREVLCTGVSGSQRGSEDWEISFRFSVREHQTGLTVAGIEGVDKDGWQYLWVRYRTEVDGDAHVLTNIAEYVVVADVFRTANFANLGIGT